MSHACLIVSPMKELIASRGIEAALAHEMEPFDEKDECFRDGSRWDWYRVGGRYTGHLSTYDAYTDPRNQQICTTCDGTGVRPGGLEKFGKEWFDRCHGCNGCKGTGKCLSFDLVPFDGDIVQVKNINIEELREYDIRKNTEYFLKCKDDDPSPFDGITPDMKLEDYLTSQGAGFVSAYAFLRNRHWHEAERLGWFGTSTYTECERKDMDKPKADPEAWTQKCLHKDEKTGARVICWNEPYPLWREHFVERFIKPLSPDDTLVVIDYHV